MDRRRWAFLFLFPVTSVDGRSQINVQLMLDLGDNVFPRPAVGRAFRHYDHLPRFQMPELEMGLPSYKIASVLHQFGGN